MVGGAELVGQDAIRDGALVEAAVPCSKMPSGGGGELEGVVMDSDGGQECSIAAIPTTGFWGIGANVEKWTEISHENCQPYQPGKKDESWDARCSKLPAIY